MSEKLKKIYEYVALICTVIVALATVYGAYKVFVAPKGKLKAKVYCEHFILPNDYMQQFKSISHITGENFVKSLPELEGYTEDNLKSAYILTKAIDSEFAKFFTYCADYALYSSCWRFNIKNDGKKLLSSVRLKLPFIDRVVIRHDNNKEAFIESFTDKWLDIGTIQPRDNVEVIAWSKNRPSDSMFNYFDLVHSEGIGKMIYYPISTPLFEKIVANKELPLLALLVIITILLLIRVIIRLTGVATEEAIEPKKQ